MTFFHSGMPVHNHIKVLRAMTGMGAPKLKPHGRPIRASLISARAVLYADFSLSPSLSLIKMVLDFLC